MSLKVMLITLSLAAVTLAAETLAAQWFPAENRAAAHQTTWLWIAGWLLTAMLQLTRPAIKKRFPELAGSDMPINIWQKSIVVLITVLVGAGMVALAGFTGKRMFLAFICSAIFSQAVWPGIIGTRPVPIEATATEP